MTDGWAEVRVDDKEAPLWVMEERCHPGDLRALTRSQEKIITRKFPVFKVDKDD